MLKFEKFFCPLGQRIINVLEIFKIESSDAVSYGMYCMSKHFINQAVSKSEIFWSSSADGIKSRYGPIVENFQHC